MGYSDLSNAAVMPPTISSPYGIATAGVPVSNSRLGAPISPAKKVDPFVYDVPSSNASLGPSPMPYSSASLSPPPTTQSIVSPPPQPSFAAKTVMGTPADLPQQSSFAWSTSGLGVPGTTSEVDGRPLIAASSAQYGSMPAYAGATPSFSGSAYKSAPPAMFPPPSTSGLSPFKTTLSAASAEPLKTTAYPGYAQSLSQSRVSTEMPYEVGPAPFAGTSYVGKLESDEDEDEDYADVEPVLFSDKPADVAYGPKLSAQTTYYLGGYAMNNYPGQGDPKEEMYVAVQSAPNTKAYRVEPSWMDGAWYLTAPVDFKGMEQYPDRQFDMLNTVDDAVKELEEKRQLPPLPPPRHWKEHKSCPIA
mmetsp:Transcript_100175/g.192176  ORF Transcript_100175/g.192176 Transcript_100175/m.192176 type:complete len:361 (+) Transcript_100175:83-1165(+)